MLNGWNDSVQKEVILRLNAMIYLKNVNLIRQKDKLTNKLKDEDNTNVNQMPDDDLF